MKSQGMYEFSTPMKLATIRVYPVKSLHGIPLSEATIDRRGIRWDRRWMVVDEHGMFMTQRQFPAKVLFGQNLIPAGEGVVRVDDEVRVIESL